MATDVSAIARKHNLLGEHSAFYGTKEGYPAGPVKKFLSNLPRSNVCLRFLNILGVEGGIIL